MITLDLMIFTRKIFAATQAGLASATQHCLVFSVARQDVMTSRLLAKGAIDALFCRPSAAHPGVYFVCRVTLRLVDKLLRKE